MFRQFRKLKEDEELLIGADPSEGGDPCAAICLSRNYVDVPIVFTMNTESSQFGYELDKLGRYIWQQTHVYPMIAPERNTGAATIARLKDLNYPSLFRMKDFTSTDPKASLNIGWVTSSLTRPKMLDDLSLAVRQHIIAIYDGPIIDEMQTFVRNKQGRPEARQGCHDDQVMALAIAWQLYLLGTKEGSDQFPEAPRGSVLDVLAGIQRAKEDYIGNN